MSANDSIHRLEILVKQHMNESSENNSKWSIRSSMISGRGVFASNDISIGEVIFREKPLLIGPTKSSSQTLNICIVCSNLLNRENEVCPKGCSLPVCENCCNLDQHIQECQLYCSWQPLCTGKGNLDSIRAITAIRGLFLKQREKDLIYAMQANVDPSYRKEIDIAMKWFRNPTNDVDTIQYLHRIVSVLNTNAFKVVNEQNGTEKQFRGLYPLAGTMNHQCVPNTCHIYENNNLMVIKAVTNIPKGTEITTTYSNLLWSNLSRQIFLKVTKKFLCTCWRCQDPTENKTYLAALYCRKNGCNGWLLPTDFINRQWKCLKCFQQQDTTKIQDIVVNVVNSRTKSGSLTDIIEFISEKVPKFCPPVNQFIVELKLHLIWKSKRTSEKFSKDNIKIRISYCQEIIEILDKLKAGECTLKALLLNEIVISEKDLQNLSN